MKKNLIWISWFLHGIYSVSYYNMTTKVSTTKMNYIQVSVRLLYSAFPLFAIMFCHQSHGSLKTTLEEKDDIWGGKWAKLKYLFRR